MTGAKRTAAAAVLSFAVYATPLVGPHAAWLLGEVLYRELAEILRGRGREPAWVATDVALALFAQLALGLLVYWFSGRPGWLRGLAVLAPVLPAIAVLNYAYLVAIPTRFLIEPDTAPERAGWPLECVARDVWVPQLGAPPVVTRDAAAPLWVSETGASRRYGLFEMPGCKVRLLELTHSSNGYVTYVAGGRALYLTLERGGSAQSWSVVGAASGKRMPLEGVDAGQFPILSTDGRSAVWLRPVQGSTPPTQFEAVVRDVDRPRERVVDLAALGRGGIQQLVELDTEAGELVAARGLHELVRVGLDGRLRGVGPDVRGVDRTRARSGSSRTAGSRGTATARTRPIASRGRSPAERARTACRGAAASPRSP